MAKSRSIFEDVGTERRDAKAPTTGAIDRAQAGDRTGIRLWLMALFGLVVTMIVVGGLTRLTGSGLSITEWAPIRGAIPPLSEAAWQAEFARYREIPQFSIVNPDMTLSQFQSIYWWEWGHRQLGRLIGLVWAAGFLWFWLRGKVPPGWTGRLLLLGALGGLQGAIGWWMVASGLTGDAVRVESYRLAVHLGLAFAILGTITWFVLRLGRTSAGLMQARRARETKLFGMSTGLMHLAFVQILFGALVAGIDAGRSYTDWPLMAGGFFPPAPFTGLVWWRAFFEDAGLVQFVHRMTGYLLAIFAVVVWMRARRSPNAATRTAFHAVLAGIAVQIVLGVVTVLNAAPWYWAILHQLMAVALFATILWARFRAGYPPAESLRGRPA